jgi:xanthine/CO dehydrogenase XdhC/CoxF family maturation factor
MGCQGKADVLLECVTPGAPAPWMTLCAAMLRTRHSGAMATVFGRRGEAAAELGDRFVLEQGGPGLLPAPGPFCDALRAALDQALAKGVASAFTCAAGAGQLDLLIEPILPPYALWIVGAGEHALPLARLAEGLGWYLGIVDHRPALATQARFPMADRIVVGHPPESLAGLPLDRRSAALVVTHVYDQDREALKALLSQPLGYLGLQGNRKRSARLLRELAEEGLELTPAQRAILHVPAGLDLGAESPEAIALSMLAEVQAALAGHPGGSLRDRTGSIHRPPPSRSS